ncbi:MAG: hypothetical protein EXS35_07455 [Pedosphaera sp.]|nr:hypothetical protein [Pedosphaera sp.]
MPAENEKIRARLAAARTNAVKALPAGYIRKSNARFAGYTTPEATVESMLWAMQHRDFPKVLASLSPEMAGEMRKGIEEGHTTIERIFDDAEKLPGLNVVGRNVTTNGLIELVIEIVPGEHTRTTRFRQINGEWKIDSESE